MADDDIKKDAPPPTPAETKPDKELAPDKQAPSNSRFKNQEDAEKSYSELERKLGEQSDEIRQSREFMTVVQPLLEEVRNDPTLFKLIDEKLRAKVTPPATPGKDTPPSNSTDGEMRNVTVDLLLAKFEGEYGIDKLPPEERKQLRQGIGDAIYELTGTPLTNVDLRRLSSTLSAAYKIATYGKSTPETQDVTTESDRASLSSLPGSPGKPESGLTPDEARVATRLGLTREQYLSGKKH